VLSGYFDFNFEQATFSPPDWLATVDPAAIGVATNINAAMLARTTILNVV
jgi:hypothetical protein